MLALETRHRQRNVYCGLGQLPRLESRRNRLETESLCHCDSAAAKGGPDDAGHTSAAVVTVILIADT